MALQTQAAQTQAAATLDDAAAPSPIRATYLKRTQASAEAHARAERVMPGGTSRQAGYWAPYPLTIDRAEGVRLWDLDGNRYIDLINNYTAMVHGHAYPPIVEATARQLPHGTGWSAGNAPQSDLAARRTRDILRNCYYILAFELICAAQAAEIRGVETLSTATRLMHGILRQTVPYLDRDVPLTDYIEAVAALFETGELLKALPKDSGAYDW